MTEKILILSGITALKTRRFFTSIAAEITANAFPVKRP